MVDFPHFPTVPTEFSTLHISPELRQICKRVYINLIISKLNGFHVDERSGGIKIGTSGQDSDRFVLTRPPEDYGRNIGENSE